MRSLRRFGRDFLMTKHRAYCLDMARREMEFADKHTAIYCGMCRFYLWYAMGCAAIAAVFAVTPVWPLAIPSSLATWMFLRFRREEQRTMEDTFQQCLRWRQRYLDAAEGRMEIE